MNFIKNLFKRLKKIIGLLIFLVIWLIIFLIMCLSKLVIPTIPTIYVLLLPLLADIVLTIIYLLRAFIIVQPQKAVVTTFLGEESRILLSGLHFLIPFEEIYKKLDEDEIDLMQKISEKKYSGLICRGDNVSLLVRVRITLKIDYGSSDEDLKSNIRKFTYTTDNPDSTIFKSIEKGLRDLTIRYDTWLKLKVEDTMKLSQEIVNKYIGETYGQTITCEILNIEPEDSGILDSYNRREKAINEKEVAKTNAEAKAIEEKLQIEAIGDQIEYLMKKFKRSYEDALEVVRYQDNQGILDKFAEKGNTLIAQNPISFVSDIVGKTNLGK